LSQVVEAAGFRKSTVDFSLFVMRTRRGTVVLLVYVDDLIITGDDMEGIAEVKHILAEQFIMDLGALRYFLSIEVAHNKVWSYLSKSIL
jgi:hypothetical protein